MPLRGVENQHDKDGESHHSAPFVQARFDQGRSRDPEIIRCVPEIYAHIAVNLLNQPWGKKKPQNRVMPSEASFEP